MMQLPLVSFSSFHNTVEIVQKLFFSRAPVKTVGREAGRRENCTRLSVNRFCGVRIQKRNSCGVYYDNQASATEHGGRWCPCFVSRPWSVCFIAKKTMK